MDLEVTEGLACRRAGSWIRLLPMLNVVSYGKAAAAAEVSSGGVREQAWEKSTEEQRTGDKAE